MLTLLIIIVVGGLIGWAASKIMGTDPQQGILLNIVVGIVGALLAGFLLSPLLGVDSILDDPLSIPAILISLVGAVLLVWIVKMVRRNT